MSKDKEERVLMKKAKLALGLSAVAVMALGLSACNEVTAKEGVVLTYTDASGNRIEYTANDLLGTYAYGNTAASTSFDKVYELLIRNYYKSASNDVKSSINTDAQKKVDAILENAAKNASSNGTTYEEELEKLLDSNNVENVDELFEAKVYEVEKSRYEDDYYSDANLEAMRDGEDAKGNPFFPDVDDPTQADDEGYLVERAPYHVSHILVKLDADSDLTQGKISAADAKQIGYVIRALAGVNDNGTAQSEESERDSFGAIANRLSDDGSADSYGELGIVDTNTVFEQYVQEFGLGMYAYDAIYNKQTSEYRDQHKTKLLPDNDVTFGDHDEAVLDYFKNLGIGTIPFGAAEALLTTAEITDNNGRSVNGGSEVFYPRNIIFNKYFNKHNIAVITPNEIPYNLYKDDAETVMKEVEFVYNHGGISLYGVSKANYGYDDDEMDAFEYSSGSYHQKGGTREAFDRMIQMSYEAESDEGYTGIAELLDLDEFIRYMAAICYTGTGDWVLNSNNVKGYRLQDGGRFHFVFFDQDLTWEHTNNVEQLDGNEIITLYRNLKQNKTFRRQFVTAYCILHGSIYTPERCRHIADSICALVKDALAFDSRYTATTYRKLQETMWEESHREARMQALMKSYALSDSIHVSINTNCPFTRIQIDGMDVPFSLFDGVLFGPVSLSTNSADGYRFIGWKDQQGKWLSHEAECLIAAGGNYTAVYDEQRDPDISPLCINEVSAANDIYVNDYGKRADWIELYNRGPEPIDVARWFFSDDKNSPTKYQIYTSGEVSTIIQPGEHLVVWCDGKPSITQLHLPFKLKNTDNSTLYLQSANGEWSDSLRYDSHSPKESVGRYPDGGNGIWTFYHPSIGTASIPTSYDRPVNSGVNALPPAIRDEELKNISYYTLSGIKTSRPLGSIYIKVSTSGAEQRKLLGSPR